MCVHARVCVSVCYCVPVSLVLDLALMVNWSLASFQLTYSCLELGAPALLCKIHTHTHALESIQIACVGKHQTYQSQPDNLGVIEF